MKKGKENRRKITLHPCNLPAANFFVGEKINPKREGGGDMIETHNIYPYGSVKGKNKNSLQYTFKILQ